MAIAMDLTNVCSFAQADLVFDAESLLIFDYAQRSEPLGFF